MDAAQVADVEGTVLTAAALSMVVLGVLRVAAPQRFEDLRAGLAPLALPLAAAVAVGATAGSLWFSEGPDFPPCELCWYQRIAMYPLAVLLTIAAWRRDRGVRGYAAVIAAAGVVVSAWHVYVETFPERGAGGCDPTNPCTIRWVEGLGFWTIPRMALTCFALILALLALDRTVQEDPA
jgi:hypothetical protein